MYHSENRYTVYVMRWSIMHPELGLSTEIDVTVDAKTMSPVFCGQMGGYEGTETKLKARLAHTLEEYFRATMNKA
jgi:hypothetical protein